MPPRTLLVTFDAFGTLFAPRIGIASQYASVAREHGVYATEVEVGEAFKKAFKSISKEYPNYGKKIGMNPEDWWTRIVNDTFIPLTTSGTVPGSLAPAMISHFSSSAAYRLHPCVPSLFASLRSDTTFDHTIIGVISNSDPRVPAILRSLGLGVRSYESSAPASSTTHRQDCSLQESDTEGMNGMVDFVTLSYDVGHEKPDQRVFDAAFRQAKMVAGARSGSDKWVKVHVGDDKKKDVEAAERAGWKGISWDDGPEADKELRRFLGEAGCVV